MVASELSSVVVLKFRRLYDRWGRETPLFFGCSIVVAPCLLYAVAGSFEVAVYSADALKPTAHGFHRGLPEGFNPQGSWMHLALHYKQLQNQT